MGLNIKNIITKKEVDFEFFRGKVIAVDGFNILYQFLTTIRQADGTPLMNKKGQVTSHLNGLFFRTARLMRAGIKVVFVFDGKPPHLKLEERQRRRELKQLAQEKYEVAKKSEDLVGMKKFASRATYLNSEMVEQAKTLISLLGLPIVQAPSEGEAQVAYLVNQGDAFAGVSQDYDTLLYGCPLLVHNLNVVGRKKMPGRLAFKTVKPEIIILKDLLANLEISQEQLIHLSILIGTDYNRGGVKGIGPKKALKLVKEYNGRPAQLFKDVNFADHCVPSWKEIYQTFTKMPVEKKYSLKFSSPNIEKLKQFLLEEHDFSKSRIEKTLKELDKQTAKSEQKSLAGF